jgi:hypothetical protein
MKKKHLRELKYISSQIPEELIARLMTKEKQFHTLKTVVEDALTKPDSEVPPREKQRLQSLLDSGYLEKEVDVTDKDVEQQISDLYDKLIAASVKAGRLPKKAPQMKLLNNKGKKYVRKQHARIKALLDGGSTDGDKGPDSKNQEERPARAANGGVLPTLGVERREEGEEGSARA